MMCVNCAPGRQRDLHDGHDESRGAEVRLRVGLRLDLREDLFRARRALYPDGMRSDFGCMASNHRSCSIKMKVQLVSRCRGTIFGNSSHSMKLQLPARLSMLSGR